MRSALRAARAWVACLLAPPALIAIPGLGLVHQPADQQQGEDRG